jgi:hypothetical protein
MANGVLKLSRLRISCARKAARKAHIAEMALKTLNFATLTRPRKLARREREREIRMQLNCIAALKLSHLITRQARIVCGTRKIAAVH